MVHFGGYIVQMVSTLLVMLSVVVMVPANP